MVYGVAHIFLSFNDTSIHVTDLSGTETLVQITAQEAADRDESSSHPSAATLAAQDVAQQCREHGVTALHVKLHSGNMRSTPGLGAFERPCSFWHENWTHRGCLSDSHRQLAPGKERKKRKEAVNPL